MEESLLNEIFESLGSENLLDQKVLFTQLSQNNQNQIQLLNQQLNEIHQNYENSIKNHEIAETDVKEEIENTKLQLEAIRNEMKEPVKELTQFLNKTKNFDDYSNIDLYRKLVGIAELVTNPKEDIRQKGIQDMADLIQQESNEFIKEIRSTAYTDIESMIRNFSVSAPNALKQIFFAKGSANIAKATKFFSLIENIQIDPEWPTAVAECTYKIYKARMRFHADRTDVKVNSSYITLIINLLKNSIQSASYVLLAVEKHFKTNEIMKTFSNMIFTGVCEILREKSDNQNIHSLRAIFTEGAAFDEWAQDVDIIEIPPLCPLLYEKFGVEWDSLEFESFKYTFDEMMSNTQPDDVAIALTNMINGLYNASPETLEDSQKMKHFRGSLVLCQRFVETKLAEKLKNYDNLAASCAYINALYLMAMQVRVFYDMSDQTCNDLLTDSEEAVKKSHELASNFGTIVEAHFEQEAEAYLLRKSINPINGPVSPEITAALDTISPMISTVKKTLHKHLFELSFISTIQKKIDDVIYRHVVKVSAFKVKGSIDQFAIDVDAIILCVGGDDLRKLRSAKVILTQKEEKFLDVELSESDIQKLMIQAGMGG